MCRWPWWASGRERMDGNSTRNDLAEYSPVSRRQALLGIGTMAAGSLGLAVVSTDRARASVQLDTLTVPDATFEAERVTPRLALDVTFEYDVGGEAVDEVWFGVTVDGTRIASDGLRTTQAVGDGTHTLSGLVTDSDAWSSADFQVAVGEQVSRDLAVTVTFEVRRSDGSVIAGDAVEDTAAVTVAHPQDEEFVATVGATGQITDAS